MSVKSYLSRKKGKKKRLKQEVIWVSCRHACSQMTVNKWTLKIWEIPRSEQGVFIYNGALSSWTVGPIQTSFTPRKPLSLSVLAILLFSQLAFFCPFSDNSGLILIWEMTLPPPMTGGVGGDCHSEFLPYPQTESGQSDALAGILILTNEWQKFWKCMALIQKWPEKTLVLSCLPSFPSVVLLALPSVSWAKLNQRYRLPTEDSNGM